MRFPDQIHAGKAQGIIILIVVQGLCEKALKLVTCSLENLGTRLQKAFKQICTWWQHWAWPFWPEADSSQAVFVPEIHALSKQSVFLPRFFTGVNPAVVRRSSCQLLLSLPLYLSDVLPAIHFLYFSSLASASCKARLSEGHDLRYIA